jgi:flagellar biosynthesis anti-sigma factor FlgM
MRIGLNAPDQQSSPLNKQRSLARLPPTSPKSSPAVITPLCRRTELRSAPLPSQAMGMPEVRQAQVDSLRQSVSSGQYQLDPNAIADAILRGG